MRRLASCSRAKTRRAGVTLIELLFSAGIVMMIMLTSMQVMQRDAQLSQSTIGITVAETRAQAMLYELEKELADARGYTPSTQLTFDLSSGPNTVANVIATTGFPPIGTMLVDRGSGVEERIGYNGLTQTTLAVTARGLQCTGDGSHAAPASVLWAGVGEPLASQQNPPANSWDGQAQVLGNSVFFRGDGSGFSYQVPVDPGGANPPNYLVGDDVQWGAVLKDPAGATYATVQGWNALVFQPARVIQEATTGDDINLDGDTLDTFDVGQIRRLTWDAGAPIPADTMMDVGLGPRVVLQEQCNWGGDLDGDGFDDPLFLWDEARQQLTVRLFIIGDAARNMPIVRRVESLTFLRN